MRGNVGERARDRSLCAGWVRLTPQPSTRPPCHAPVHALIMLHIPTSVRSPHAGGSREVAAAGHRSSRAWASDDWAGWFESRGDWLQLVSRCGRVCVARTASSDLDLACACTACSCGGRCLRRSRASRARRGQPQRMCDGRGMYCGRSGGGRVLVGAIYSHIRSDHFLYAF